MLALKCLTNIIPAHGWSLVVFLFFELCFYHGVLFKYAVGFLKNLLKNKNSVRWWLIIPWQKEQRVEKILSPR